MDGMVNFTNGPHSQPRGQPVLASCQWARPAATLKMCTKNSGNPARPVMTAVTVTVRSRRGRAALRLALAPGSRPRLRLRLVSDDHGCTLAAAASQKATCILEYLPGSFTARVVCELSGGGGEIRVRLGVGCFQVSMPRLSLHFLALTQLHVFGPPPPPTHPHPKMLQPSCPCRLFVRLFNYSPGENNGSELRAPVRANPHNSQNASAPAPP
jgi:hypothetical protein